MLIRLEQTMIAACRIVAGGEAEDAWIGRPGAPSSAARRAVAAASRRLSAQSRGRRDQAPTSSSQRFH